MTENYNKYFKTGDKQQNTNDKNVSGTSRKREPKNQSIEQTAVIISEPENVVNKESGVVPPNKPMAAVVSPYKLNVRREANKLSKILCTLDPGSSIMVESVVGEWAHIYTEHGIDGYVIKEYILISQL